ncbi:MAG: hypothetical protein ABFS46_18365 [Myxococcota bacterium]
MSQETRAPESGLVDIVRDLLMAHRMTRRMFARYRQGELSFEEVKSLVWDTEDAVLFRLKERSHSLFRRERGESEVVMRREALFDLAVGSLFHEAMKFRENFYQRSVYGPKVHELRSGAEPESEELFREFEKILEGSAVRLDEALQETEALLSQATGQLRVLLAGHSSNGLVARYLTGHVELAEDVFGQDLDSLLADLYGSARAGFQLAARSYLRSGYFREAEQALVQARAHGGEDPELAGLACFARGMSAFLDGAYPQALEGLEGWLATDPAAEETSYASLAFAAVSRIPQLVADDASLAEAATGLASRIQTLLPPSGDQAAEDGSGWAR